MNEATRPYQVGEQGGNVLAVYRPTDRLEGGDVLAQVWRDDFASEREWRAAAKAVAKAMNELEADQMARPRYVRLGELVASDDEPLGHYRVKLAEVLDTRTAELTIGCQVYVRDGDMF